MPFYKSSFRCAAAISLALGMAATMHAQLPALVSFSPMLGDNVPPQGANPEWVPQGLNLLTRNASWHTDFNFDRSMLALAGKLEGFDEPTRQAIARLNGVSVHSYRYREPGIYDMAEVQSIRAQYDALGWKHVVSKKPKAGTTPGSTIPTRTDLWIRLNGMNVAGVAVLIAEPSSLNLVSVSGDISTIDLLKLRGHFGIPKFDPDSLPQ